MKNLSIFLLSMSMVISAQAKEFCERTERVIDYSGRVETIHASIGQLTEIVFDSDIIGAQPEIPNGLVINSDLTANLPDRLFISVSRDDYTGKILVHDDTGNSYHLAIVARKDCANSTVRVKSPALTEAQNNQPISAPTRVASRKKLIEYMLMGDNITPPGYRIEKVKGSLDERNVAKQGSVNFYIDSIYTGGNYNGFVLLLENTGKAPYRVQIEAIDFNSEAIISTFGKVKEVAMLPTSFTLSPSPEFASQNFSREHLGVLYIVSKKEI